MLLGGGLDADAARDGADFDATAGSADMGAKRMLVLVFDDDRNIGANFSGDGFGGEMETGVLWNGNFDAAGSGFEMPIGVAGGIAGDFNSTGSAAGLDVVIGADDGDGSVDAVNANAAGGGIEINRAADVLNFLGAAGGGNAEFGFTRDFDGVGDGSVAKTVHGFPDANDACVLFDGR